MEIKNENYFEDIIRMNEIAEIYERTKQTEKCEKYHYHILKLCDKDPKNELLLQYKINSLNRLKKHYKSLETTNELLKLNPNNLMALFNIAKHIQEALHV